MQLVENINGHINNLKVVVPCIHKALSIAIRHVYEDHILLEVKVQLPLQAGLRVHCEQRECACACVCARECGCGSVGSPFEFPHPGRTLVFLGFSRFAARFLPLAGS